MNDTNLQDAVECNECRNYEREVERDKARIRELEAWQNRAVASMDAASKSAGVCCCDLIPERILELEQVCTEHVNSHNEDHRRVVELEQAICRAVENAHFAGICDEDVELERIYAEIKRRKS